MKRKRRTKVTREMLERMRELRMRGLPYSKIADELNLSIMTVCNRLKAGKKESFFQRLRRKFK